MKVQFVKIAFFALLGFLSCKEAEATSIVEIQLDDPTCKELYVFRSYSMEEAIDTIVIAPDGKFHWETEEINELFFISNQNAAKHYNYYLILLAENNQISYSLFKDQTNYDTNSPSNKEISNFYTAIMSNLIDPLAVEQSIIKNNNNAFGVFALKFFGLRLFSEQKFQTLINTLEESCFTQFYYGRQMKRLRNPIKHFPQLEVRNPEDQVVNLEFIPGHYTILDFWATWCGPCIKAMDNYENILKQNEDLNFKVVALSIDEKEQDWKRFLNKKQFNFADYLIPSGSEKDSVTEKIYLDAIPRLMVINDKGDILQNRTKDIESAIAFIRSMDKK